MAGTARFGVSGAEQLRALGVQLSAEGARGKVFRSRLRRSFVTAAAPIVAEAKANFRSTYGQFGGELAAAIRPSVRTAGPVVGVSLVIKGSALPGGKQGLGPLVEGFGRPWRHPLFGDRNDWYDQAAHPELGPSVKRHLPYVQGAVLAVIDETALALARGT